MHLKYFLKGAQAWEFFARIFYTTWTHLGMWLRDWTKNKCFYQLTPDFEGFWFFAAYSVCGKKKIEGRPKLNGGGGYFWTHMYA